MQPGLGDDPFALDGAFRNAGHAGGFGDRQAAEITELDDAGLERVEPFELFEGEMEIEDIDRGFGSGGAVGFDAEGGAGAALFGAAGAGVIDENAAHEEGGEGEEVGAIFPVAVGSADEAHESLVDERGGLEGVAGALVAEVVCRDAVKFRVSRLQQAVQGGGIAFAPGADELGQVGHRGCRHWRASGILYRTAGSERSGGREETEVLIHRRGAERAEASQRKREKLALGLRPGILAVE